VSTCVPPGRTALTPSCDYGPARRSLCAAGSGKSGSDKGFAILALQAQKKADLQRVTSLLEAREPRLAAGEQLADATGCRFGELPPFRRLLVRGLGPRPSAA
jgi:prolyl-tRNA editing enzyme YbaK/EbsC (Cys-tRNA(Pro) deacylase)